MDTTIKLIEFETKSYHHLVGIQMFTVINIQQLF